MPEFNRNSVTVSIPFFRTRRYVCRAVESLLAQTHRELCVVVVNDGDADPPWAELAHIHDPRLVRFSWTHNRGCYFVHEVVLRASRTPYFLVQDSDDWSLPERVSTLLSRLRIDRSDLAFSAWQQYREREHGAVRLHSIQWLPKEA